MRVVGSIQAGRTPAS